MDKSPLSLYVDAELLRLYVCCLLVNKQFAGFCYLFSCNWLTLNDTRSRSFPKAAFKRNRPPCHIFLEMIEFCGYFFLYLIQVELVHASL